MTDVHSRKIRSYNMSRIRSKDTKPELIVRKFLHSNGFRLILHDKRLPSKPDIVLPKYKTVVLVHGCFWHGHENCKFFVKPKTNTERWLNKIHTNKANDERALVQLKKAGWNVITVWECQLKTDREHTLERICRQILKMSI